MENWAQRLENDVDSWTSPERDQPLDAFLSEAEAERSRLLSEFSDMILREEPARGMAIPEEGIAYWQWEFAVETEASEITVSLLMEHLATTQVWQVEVALEDRIYSAAGNNTSAVFDAFTTVYRYFSTFIQEDLEGVQ